MIFTLWPSVATLPESVLLQDELEEQAQLALRLSRSAAASREQQ